MAKYAEEIRSEARTWAMVGLATAIFVPLVLWLFALCSSTR